MDPLIFDLTIREWVQVAQFLCFGFSAVALTYLLVVRNGRRVLLLPLWLVVVHTLVFVSAVLWKDVLNQTIVISFTDWSALNRLHWGLTISIYIPIMMTLKRHLDGLR
jgi:hypothetical protein